MPGDGTTGDGGVASDGEMARGNDGVTGGDRTTSGGVTCTGHGSGIEGGDRARADALVGFDNREGEGRVARGSGMVRGGVSTAT